MENSKPAEEKKCLSLERRTLLERYLILVCVLLFIAFLVMIGLLIHLQNVHKRSRKEICTSDICKRQAGSILENMDFTVNPCQDFYEFTCGSYMKYKDIYTDRIDRYKEVSNYLIHLAKILLENPDGINDYPFYAKMKKYYQSCLNKPTGTNETLEEFLNATQLDSWPLSEDSQTSSIMEDAVVLSAVYEDINLLFTIKLGPNNSYINMDKGYSAVNRDASNVLREKYYIKEKQYYMEMFHYVLNKLFFSVKDSERYIEKIVDFETSLAKIQKIERNDNSTNSTISELQSKCPQIRWRYVFKLYFKYIGRAEEYKEELPLKISSMGYINDLCNLVGNSNKNKRIIYNLLVWKMFILYLAEFDFNFRQFFIDMLNVGDEMISGSNILKWKACIVDMKRYIRIGLDYMMINLINPEVVKELKTYTKQISEMLEEIIFSEDWFDDYSKNITKIKLKSINYYAGYANGSVNVDFINLIFKNIIITDNYMENILSVKKQMHIDNLFNKSISIYINKEMFIEPFKVYSYYRGGQLDAILAMSLGLMNPPFYAYGLPKYANYGGIVFLIGHELSHGFHHLNADQEYCEEVKINSDECKPEIDWPEEFLEEYKRRRNCLIKQYSQFPLEGNIMIPGNKTIWDNFADNSGLILAFRTYEKYLKDHGEEPDLPGLDFTNKQMFFISYAQQWCEVIDSIEEKYEREVHSPGKYRLLVPLMNSPEFSKVFNCPLHSYMNPEHKCKIWG